MRKILLILFVVFFSVGFYFFSRGELYRNVKASCESQVPSRQCLKIDSNNSYYVFKDRKGEYHNLLVPIQEISGVESGRLYFNGSNFFYNAWQDRGLLRLEGVRDETVYALAVNSSYGRSQDQFHIHISCLKPGVHRVLTKKVKNLRGQWEKLFIGKEKQEFNAVKISYLDFKGGAVFPLVFGFSVNNKVPLKKVGVGVVVFGGEVLVLVRVVDFRSFDFASIGDILDYNCTLVEKSSSN
ncbi:CDP-diacylglycerol diphosphatase [Pseudomonas aeruginosa]|uniref:CDP-diacylglycerol diphosphatase n=1 Tax=Pseudomonas aeruginosa TaxID=287 RepID=UPI003F2B2FF7